MFLNKNKPAARNGKVFLLNAGREFEKGDPKNYIPDEGITRIAEIFKAWDEKTVGVIGNHPLGRMVSREEIVKNDYNISPSRYIQTGEGEEYRSIAEIVDELDAIEEEAESVRLELKGILKTLR